MTGGLELFCNWRDLDRDPASTTAKLLRAGAGRAIAMVQVALNFPRHEAEVRRFAEHVRDADLALSLCTGPAVIEAEEPLRHRDRLAALCHELHATPMLDAEPVHVRTPREQRWSPERLAPWLEVPDLEITTTRMEAPHLGAHARRTYAQLEGQTSTATLSHALAIFTRYAPRELIVPVLGSFDSPGDKRTLAEMETDIARCHAQAIAAGRLAVWVAQTTGDAECALLARWARETWPAASA